MKYKVYSIQKIKVHIKILLNMHKNYKILEFYRTRYREYKKSVNIFKHSKNIIKHVIKITN